MSAKEPESNDFMNLVIAGGIGVVTLGIFILCVCLRSDNKKEKDKQGIKPEEKVEEIKDIKPREENNIQDKKDEEKKEEYHTRKKKLKTQVKKEGEGIGELEVDSLKSMRNRLIYCERSSETLQKKIINRECETIKLNRVNHVGIFHQWDRFDSYMNLVKKKLEKFVL